MQPPDIRRTLIWLMGSGSSADRARPGPDAAKPQQITACSKYRGRGKFVTNIPGYPWVS